MTKLNNGIQLKKFKLPEVYCSTDRNYSISQMPTFVESPEQKEKPKKFVKIKHSSMTKSVIVPPKKSLEQREQEIVEAYLGGPVIGLVNHPVEPKATNMLKKGANRSQKSLDLEQSQLENLQEHFKILEERLDRRVDEIETRLFLKDEPQTAYNTKD